MIDYLPTKPVKSVIIDYNQLAEFWAMIPDYCRIRVPEKIFRATEDGYNIKTLYERCGEYHGSYHVCVMFIKSLDGAVFGCFLDTFPTVTTFSQFQGGDESFVFMLKPGQCHWNTTYDNDYFMLCEPTYMTVGAKGDGPAIRLDEKLKNGKSYSSETFKNPILTGKEGF